MSASSIEFEHVQGVTRVVPEADGIVAVCLQGEFDLTNADALGAEIDAALESGNDLIVDMSDATFIDSSVINVLLRASRMVRQSEQSMILQLRTPALVERAIAISGVEHVLTRAYDRQEAVRLLQQQVEAA